MNGKAIITSFCYLALSLSPILLRAQDQTPFPTPPDKKGLQVQMVDDAIALGVHHAALNVSLGALMDPAHPFASLPPLTHASDYPVQAAPIRHLDSQVKALSNAGMVVYLILLAYPTHDPVRDGVLLHPKARKDGKYNIAAFNTETESGRKNYSALIEYLAERYSGAHPEHGRVWGYIVGNEVQSQWMWYNLDHMPMAEVASEYEKAVRLTSQAVRKHSAHARCYLSLDHHWNASMPGISDQEAYRGRDFLDAFAKLAKERGDFEWHLAIHPYPDDLGNPRTWLDKAAWPNDDSPHITFKNLEVVCQHLQRPELAWQGQPRRIILSEQGLHCLATPDGETLQAAGYAYAWEKIARQPVIDAFIWHRHVDHAQEGGLRLGLWTNKPGAICEADRKRPLYDLFHKAGTPEWDAAARFALPIVGMKSWSEFDDPKPQSPR